MLHFQNMAQQGTLQAFSIVTESVASWREQFFFRLWAVFQFRCHGLSPSLLLFSSHQQPCSCWQAHVPDETPIAGPGSLVWAWVVETGIARYAATSMMIESGSKWLLLGFTPCIPEGKVHFHKPGCTCCPVVNPWMPSSAVGLSHWVSRDTATRLQPANIRSKVASHAIHIQWVCGAGQSFGSATAGILIYLKFFIVCVVRSWSGVPKNSLPKWCKPEL